MVVGEHYFNVVCLFCLTKNVLLTSGVTIIEYNRSLIIYPADYDYRLQKSARICRHRRNGNFCTGKLRGAKYDVHSDT